MILDLVAASLTTFTDMFRDPGNRWFTFYLLTSLLSAWIVYQVQSRHDPEMRSLGFIGFVFPGEIYGHPSAKLDYWFYVINKICFAAVFASTIVVAQGSSWLSTQVMKLVLDGPLFTQGPIAAMLVTTILYGLAFDFGLWLAHYLFHRIPILWEFHKVHHSVEVMTPFSASRVHPLDDFVHYCFSGLFSGLMLGLCRGMFGSDALIFTAFQIHILVFLFYMIGFHLRHSHVWLPYTGWLGHILVSPAHHQLHHSAEKRHWDRNMGFMFAVWDWMFGTLYVPSREREVFKLGIGGEEKEFSSVWKLYWLPLHKVWRKLLRRKQPASASASQLDPVAGKSPAAPSKAAVATGS